MTEPGLLFADIQPKLNSSTSVEGRAEKPLWTRTDNSFRFDFDTDDSPACQEASAPSDRNSPAGDAPSFTGQDSAFAFHFQIPSAPPEDADVMEASDKPALPQEVDSPSEPSAALSSKSKKKNKPGKKKASDSKEAEQKPSSAEASPGGEDTELSVEEQLQRQLDWCIEQLELGMKSKKGTPKQKEEASRALKTLRSSKAPLAKKRQVMRAVNGDYRKKMEEEKSKQFKLIQGEMASAKVKAVSDSPKSFVFHRRAEIKSQTSAAEEKDVQQSDEGRDAEVTATDQQTEAFVFTPSKEEFCFNFL